MLRALAMLAILPIVACGDEPMPQGPKAKQARESTVPPPRASPAEPTAEESAVREGAAQVLRSYYALIESGDFAGVTHLRSDRKTDAKRLADNFRSYAHYEVQVGTPSRPVKSGDYLFVDVPVMITGTFKGGKTFGSGGRVTMRRATEGGDLRWRVYTG